MLGGGGSVANASLVVGDGVGSYVFYITLYLY